MSARARRLATAVGVALVALHAAAGALMVRDCRRPDLRVTLRAAPAAPDLDLDATLPAGLGDRVTLTIDGAPAAAPRGGVGAGMHRVEWSVRYRGGFERRVGTTQLVGPFQRPEAPPCAVRLVVGQRFLDDGAASPGTITHIVKATIEYQMDGFDQWPIGSFTKVSAIAARWVAAAETRDPDATRKRLRTIVDRATAAAKSTATVIPPDGYGEVTLTLAFENGNVPLEVTLVPVVRDDQLVFDTAVEAKLDLDNWFYQRISNLIGGDKLVTRIAKREMNAALVAALAAPPPLELSGGRTIQIKYCPHRPAEIAGGAWAALPMAVAISAGPGGLLPVEYGAVDRASLVTAPAIGPDAPLAVELELDAINALVHELWRTGFLDEQLAAADLEGRFNGDPLVQELLSVRIARARLALPPTAIHDGHGFALGAETTLDIDDAGQKTAGHLWGTIGFEFAQHAATPAPAGATVAGATDAPIGATVRLGELRLTCEPRAGELRPCYGDLVEAARGNADAIHGELTRLFTGVLSDLFVRANLGAPGQPAYFTVDRIALAATPAPPSGLLRIDLFGTLHSE